MPPTMKALLLALTASMTLAACGSSSSGSGSSSQASTAATSTSQPTTAASSGGAAAVKTASNATLGATVLVNAQGLTLYHLSGEGAGKFICTSTACLQVWHPVAASSGASSGSVSSLGTVKRPDGTEQLTYKGTPLYTFAPDKKAGDVGGQDVKDVGTWTAVTTSPSSAPATTSSQSAPAAPASSSGGSPY